MVRIVFFGTPEFAVPSLRRLLESPHQVVAVVSQPDRPRGRGKRLTPSPVKALALEHGRPVLHPDKLRDERFLQDLSSLAPDLGVVAAYGRILPEALLAVPRLGMINVHASVLPRWRGAAPIHRAVIAGDQETGVTIMRVVKELDAGGMFAIARRPIGPDETTVDVERDLAVMGADLLLGVVNAMAAGRAREVPQDETLVTYAPKITREEGTITWNQPAPAIHNLVRGLQPWPLVSGRLDGRRVLIHRSKVVDRSTNERPGTVVAVAADRLEVACGEGTLLALLQVQPEGRRVMTAREYLAGHHLTGGARIDRG